MLLAVSVDEWGNSRVQPLGWTGDIWKAVAAAIVVALIVLGEIASHL